jgi:UDPglucose--hexose-1-phosphate uridylyltransferase
MSDADARSEIRQDPIRGHMTIIAPNRGHRPNAAIRPTEAVVEPNLADDPFLAGNEHLTTEELFSLRDENDDWSVRVIRNKYPALRHQREDNLPVRCAVPSPERSSDPPASGRVFSSNCLSLDADTFVAGDHAVAGVGQHEVIVECPHFETELANLPCEQVAKVLQAWQSRLRSIRDEGRFDYVLIFKNSGRAAGTSLPHSHSQLIATENHFPNIKGEHDRARRFYLEQKTSLLEHTVLAARGAGLVVCEEQGFVAFCPFASRFSNEVWVAGGDEPFHVLNTDALGSVAKLLHSLLNAIQTLHPGAAYNVLLHASPFSVCDEPWFRWRMEICPRIAGLAGFELATGCYINSVPPEVAAANLRDAL